MKKENSDTTLNSIIQRYAAVKQPKYRHADLEQLRRDYALLKEMLPDQGDTPRYRNIVNAISQTIKKMTAAIKSGRISVSEKGLNKVIQPLTRKKDHVIRYPVEWVHYKNNKGYSCFINNGLWGAWNYMVMEALGYMLLMKVGGDRFPKESLPVFDNLDSINRREEELNGNSKTSGSSSSLSSTADIESWIKKHRYWIWFDDAEFNRLTGKSLKSVEILNLLLDTARAEFKLVYPVKVKGSKGENEHLYKMNVFSRFFELVSIDKERTDGIVQSREYYVCFNTILGELFVHNLMVKYRDLLDIRLYHLPQNAQVFYRRFLIHHTYKRSDINLQTIVDRLNLSDNNITNLTATIEKNILLPLLDAGFIKSFTKAKNGDGELQYRIYLPREQDAEPAELETIEPTASKDGGSVK
jgi:hypothetical protein